MILMPLCISCGFYFLSITGQLAKKIAVLQSPEFLICSCEMTSLRRLQSVERDAFIASKMLWFDVSTSQEVVALLIIAYFQSMGLGINFGDV